MPRLDGKVALVSGAARGIGAETARLMVDAGAKVILGDILDASDTAKRIGGGDDGAAAHAVTLDVRHEASWSAAVEEAERRYGGLDILVNNAGLFLGRDFLDVTLAEWQRLVDVNLTGVFLGTKVAAPALRAAGAKSAHGSAIVNLSSIAGLVGSVADPLYSMTKGGVTIFTKATALSLARRGDRIRVNSVHPGVIETEMGTQALSSRMRATGSNDVDDYTRQIHPIGRLGTAEDVARAIVFLASDDARFMTGSALVVDGGFTAQ